MSTYLRSGDIIKLAPNWNNKAGYIALHKIHFTLSIYKYWGITAMTWIGYESTQLGGDRRLYAIGRPEATITLPYVQRCALDAILDHVNFTEGSLDVLVTAKLWKKNYGFRDYNARMSYLPPANQAENPFEIPDVQFVFNDLAEI